MYGLYNIRNTIRVLRGQINPHENLDCNNTVLIVYVRFKRRNNNCTRINRPRSVERIILWPRTVFFEKKKKMPFFPL